MGTYPAPRPDPSVVFLCTPKQRALALHSTFSSTGAFPPVMSVYQLASAARPVETFRGGLVVATQNEPPPPHAVLPKEAFSVGLPDAAVAAACSISFPLDVVGSLIATPGACGETVAACSRLVVVFLLGVASLASGVESVGVVQDTDFHQVPSFSPLPVNTGLSFSIRSLRGVQIDSAWL